MFQDYSIYYQVSVFALKTSYSSELYDVVFSFWNAVIVCSCLKRPRVSNWHVLHFLQLNFVNTKYLIPRNTKTKEVYWIIYLIKSQKKRITHFNLEVCLTTLTRSSELVRTITIQDFLYVLCKCKKERKKGETQTMCYKRTDTIF